MATLDMATPEAHMVVESGLTNLTEVMEEEAKTEAMEIDDKVVEATAEAVTVEEVTVAVVDMESQWML